MPVSSVGSTSDSSAISSAISGTSGNNSLGEQEFLKLLTTELSNQNPLDPSDQKEFLAQLAQFSTVEGVNNLQNSEKRVQATQLLGKRVAATTTEEGIQKDVIGQVTSVRFASDGIHLAVQDSHGNNTEVLMTQVTNVGN